MSLCRLYIFVFLIFGLAVTCRSQERSQDHLPTAARLIYWQQKQTDSGKYIISFYEVGCKRYLSVTDFYPTNSNFKSPPLVPVEPPKQKVKFLTVHGNVSYDFYYRTKEETAINGGDLQQHTERVYLNLLFKEKLPIKIAFASRQSNSPFFKNFYDVNFQFDRYGYNKNFKKELLNKLNAKTSQYAHNKYPDLFKTEADLKKQKEQYSAVKNWLEDPATLQKIVEERERAYFKKIEDKQDSINALKPGIRDSRVNNTKGKLDSINNLKDSVLAIGSKINDTKKKLGDSLSSLEKRLLNNKDSLVAKAKNKIDSISKPYADLYEQKKKELDSLEKKIDSTKKKADSIRNVAQKDLLKAKQKINGSVSEKELREIAADNGIELDKKSKLEKQLSAIKTLGIGRSVLDYTELTAKDISVTGVNIEYNPSYYVAFAAGKIDYRFRDFFNKQPDHNNQYIIMGRLGIGDKDHKALIFSYFTGKKNTSDFNLSDSIKSYVGIRGYAVEAIYKKDENTAISAEFAKSTKPLTGNFRENKQSGDLVRFSDESNMGINIKAQTIFPETNTRLSGFFRKTGENFQSFSLFSYNTNQTAWLIRADQAFLKNKISLTTMLRRNDFTNPFTDKTYKTSTVFKSILLNIRFPKYPSVSFGYYPGTQLYMINKEKIRESAYYILNGSIVYGYSLKRISASSSFIYNRYSSEATDSGFIAYKGTNYYASQTFFLKKLQLQGGYGYTKQPELQYYMLEAGADYALRNWLTIGAGTKYNKITGGTNYWGESLHLSIKMKQLGAVQLQYEKSYLPTIIQTLYPVEIGRVSYYKNF